MDSHALRAVYAMDPDDLYLVGQRSRGAHRDAVAHQPAVVTPRRSRGALSVEPTTGEGSIVMDERYAYSPDDDADAEDEARRAVQVAMDRRDNGGRTSR